MTIQPIAECLEQVVNPDRMSLHPDLLKKSLIAVMTYFEHIQELPDKISENLLRFIQNFDKIIEQDNKASTSLMHICFHSLEKASKFLIEKCNAKINKNGNTTLMFASLNGHKAIVRLLIEEENTEVEKIDNKGKTALSLARERNHVEVEKILLECGATR